MRKIFLAFCLYFISTAFINAQSVSNNKFSVSVDLGAGSVFGHSNLSSYGVDYRKEYKSGFSGHIKASYLLNKAFQVGLKFNLFSASENYNLARANDLAKSTQIAEDVELLYIAPQIGYRTMITDKWCLDCMAGAGYTHYNSESLNKETERECNKGFLGANADLSLTRHLYRNLYMGANISVMGGHTSSLKVETEGKEETLELNKWNRINVLRADVMLSIKVLL